MSLRLGLIGCGIFARETYVPHILAASGSVVLTCVLSRTLPSVTEFLSLLESKEYHTDKVAKFIGEQGEKDFFVSAKNLCDAVCIIVPIALLEVYIEKCLQIGLHILSEKPVCLTTAAAKRLIGLFRGREGGENTIWCVGENYRTEPAVRYASSIVRSRGPPKAFSLVVIRQQSKESKFFKVDWRSRPVYEGASVFDGGIHFIALLRAVVGGDISDVRGIYEAVDNVEVGACGSCKVGRTTGTYHIQYGAFKENVARLDLYWADGSMYVTQQKGIGYQVEVSGAATRQFPISGLTEEFNLWLGALQGGRVPTELSPEESLRDLEAIETICSQKL